VIKLIFVLTLLLPIFKGADWKPLYRERESCFIYRQWEYCVFGGR